MIVKQHFSFFVLYPCHALLRSVFCHAAMILFHSANLKRRRKELYSQTDEEDNRRLSKYSRNSGGRRFRPRWHTNQNADPTHMRGFADDPYTLYFDKSDR